MIKKEIGTLYIGNKSIRVLIEKEVLDDNGKAIGGLYNYSEGVIKISKTWNKYRSNPSLLEENYFHEIYHAIKEAFYLAKNSDVETGKYLDQIETNCYSYNELDEEIECMLFGSFMSKERGNIEKILNKIKKELSRPKAKKRKGRKK